MAQASSAQREPSMEEILASIRRIIEDSDTTRKPDNDGVTAIAPVEAELSAASPEIEAFREEFSVKPATVSVPKPSSLAEIQAEVARERTSEPPAPRNFAAETPASSRRASEASVDGEMEQGSEIRRFPTFENVRAENENPKPAILSEHAGRQVAAAFGELSAFAASRRKSFDEMAEEMLRPMLQDWLDNNLPVLVERLVREEIERVARGETR